MHKAVLWMPWKKKETHCTVLVTKSQLSIRGDTVVLFGDHRMGADGVMAHNVLDARQNKRTGMVQMDFFWTMFHSNSIIKGQFEMGVQWCSYKLVSDFFSTSGSSW